LGWTRPGGFESGGRTHPRAMLPAWQVQAHAEATTRSRPLRRRNRSARQHNFERPQRQRHSLSRRATHHQRFAANRTRLEPWKPYSNHPRPTMVNCCLPSTRLDAPLGEDQAADLVFGTAGESPRLQFSDRNHSGNGIVAYCRSSGGPGPARSSTEPHANPTSDILSAILNPWLFSHRSAFAALSPGPWGPRPLFWRAM